MRSILLAGVVLTAAGLARAAIPDDRGKSIAATRIAKPPTIDGRLDDPAWRAVRPDERFTQNFPDTGRPPSQRTALYVAYDDDSLYIAFRCYDSDAARIVERLTRRDRESDADRVQIDIDTKHDHTDAYHFDVNAAGVLVDGVRFNDTDYNPDWDGLWIAATRRDAHGWTAEIEIPWRTLRFEGHAPVMGFEARRLLQRRGEVDEWAFVARDSGTEVSRYGSLVGLRGLTPKRLFQVWPYVAARLTVLSNQSGIQNGSDVTPAAGLDLKLGVTSSLTLDATVNPDFGQVEADQVQLNLSTFELFYPEKRPFFLEGVDLFGTILKQFYTRRVGHPPPGPILDTDEVALDTPSTGRIWVASKLSGQVVPHLSIAALDALTAEETTHVRTPRDGVEERLLDPLTNYAVVRLRSDFGQSYLGAMATAVNRDESDRSPVESCPNDVPEVGDYLHPTNGRCTHDAYTAGIDGRLASPGGVWAGAFHAVYSLIENGPTRLLADGTRIGSGDQGLSVSANAGKQSGVLNVWTFYNGSTPKSDLNDAGYLRQQNKHEIGGGIGLRRRNRPIGPFQEAWTDVFGYARLSWDGVLQAAATGAEGWGRFKNLWTLYASLQWDFAPVWDNRETRDGAFTERRYGWEGGFEVKTDTRKRAFADLQLFANRVYHGMSWFSQLTVSLRPVSQLELDIIPRLNWTYGDPRWAFQTDDLGDGRRRYWFGELESQAFDVTVRGTWTFTPTLSLQLYAQVFVAGYHYSDFTTITASGDHPYLRLADMVGAPSLGAIQDSREGAINLNVVLRWEYLPGSTILAVYTRAQGQTAYSTMEGPGAPSLRYFGGGPSTDVFLIKLAYLWG